MYEDQTAGSSDTNYNHRWFYPVNQIQFHKCPNCGYCPSCGRADTKPKESKDASK